jgi:hypothetical protein
MTHYRRGKPIIYFTGATPANNTITGTRDQTFEVEINEKELSKFLRNRN